MVLLYSLICFVCLQRMWSGWVQRESCDLWRIVYKVTNVVPPQIFSLLNIFFSKQKPHHPSFTCDDHCKFSMCFGLTSISQQQKLRVGFCFCVCLFVCLFFCFFLCVFLLVVVQISGNFFLQSSSDTCWNCKLQSLRTLGFCLTGSTAVTAGWCKL